MTIKRRFLSVLIPILLVSFFSTACLLSSKNTTNTSGLHETSSDIGTTRQQPIPIGSQISVPGWQVGVKEFLRGEAAMKVINDTDWPPPPLAEGMEYALAKVFIRSTSLSEDYQSIGISNLYITGDHFIAHGDTLDGWPQPEFLYEDIYTAEAVEGWVDAVVPVGESNLELVLDITDAANTHTVRYFELDKGSSLSLPPNLGGLTPNNLGVDLANPAVIGDQVITKNWSLSVLEVLRGEQANLLLQTDNSYYTAPSQDQEYAILHIQLKYLNPLDLPSTLGMDNFYVVDKSGFRLEVGNIYPPQSEKWLNGVFLPGAEIDTRVPIIIQQGVDPVIIVFSPDLFQYNSNEKELRYISTK
jgi:hypothetical protein